MLKRRTSYWSCSKFADWIRGEKKPFALSLENWDKWKDKQARKRPIRFYISDTLLNKLQDVIFFPKDLFRSIKAYISNRYIYKIQYIKTGLKPGTYYDLDTRILYGLFNELKDFVEIELAMNYQFFHKNEKKIRRSVEDGVAYLNWASNLLDNENEPTKQATSAKEILELYNWWKEYKFFENTWDQELEKQEEEMLIRLIKLRKHLWT